MENEIMIKFVNENDIRFIITNERRVYTLRLLNKQPGTWVAMVGNIKSDDREDLIHSLLEKIFQDQRALSLLNKLHIPKNLPIVS